MSNKVFYSGEIIKELYYSGQLSCPDLSEKINKSLPFTLKVLNELIQQGSVEESGYAPSSGGRKPLMYKIKKNTFYILSVAMDQFVTRISIMDFQNRHVKEIEKFELPLQNNPAALSALADKLVDTIHHSGIDKNKIIGAGIGMPGFIDVKKGINYSFLQPEKSSLTEYLGRKLKMPVFIDNDSSLIGLAEFHFGGARNRKNVMVVNCGWGVGLGMLINGEIFRGHNGFAGEFSHMPIFNNNKLCACGKTGCLETETSLLVLIENAVAGTKAGRNSALGADFPTGNFEQDCGAIINAASNGDQFAVELISDLGYNIGIGVSILIHLINPEQVILSGRGALAGNIWLAPIQQAINKHCIPRLSANTTIAVSALGYEAELIGAAALVMENLVTFSFDVEEITQEFNI